MKFKQWLEAELQRMFPFATKEEPINTAWIKRFKSPENYTRWRVHSGKETGTAAEKLISPQISNWFVGEEKIADFIPDAVIIPTTKFSSEIIRPERRVAFVHVKTIKSVNPNNPKYDKPRHRLLAFWQGIKPFTKQRALSEYPIGGVSWVGSYVDTVWVDKDFRGQKPNLFAALMDFTRKYFGAISDPKDKLTSFEVRKSQARYDWKKSK